MSTLVQPALLYSAAVDTPAAASGAPYLEIQNNASGSTSFAVTEIGLVLAAATASSLGLVVSSAKGTPSTSVNFVQESSDLNVYSNALIATAWSVAPTIAGSPKWFRRVPAPAVAGTSVIWSFEDKPFVVGGSLLVWNYGVAAGSILGAYVRGYPVIP